MRITVVCSDLGVRVPGTKGASLHLEAVIRGFLAAEHQLQVIGVAGHGPPPPGVDAVLLPHPGRAEGLQQALNKLAFADALSQQAAARVAAFRPEVIYERLALFGDVGMALAAATGAAHVVEINALLTREEAAWRNLRLADEAVRRELAVIAGADLRVAVSEEVATAVRDMASDATTVVVPNGVDVELFGKLPMRAGARAELGVPPDAFAMCFTGTIRPWHGLDVALRALAHLPQQYMLVVAGDGEIRGELEALAGSLNVAERVRWLGHVAHERVPTVLAACNVALAPYPPLEHFAFSPLKLYEYLAAGVPVVASDLGQIRQVLSDGRFGKLVTPGDVQALAKAVLDVGNGRGTTRAAAVAGRDHALAHHGWNRRIEALTALFKELPARALAG
jgi:glycosyltransferase involved in cell wall biosynthesis